MLAPMTKETPGDGTMLRPMRWWHPLYRSVFGIAHGGAQWHIEVDFFDWDEKVALYRNGIQDRIQKGTSRFELPDGSRIDAAMSTYGMRRARLVEPGGTTHQLTPAEGTAERWRADLDRDRPRLSRTIGVASWTIVVIALLLQIPQLAELGAELSGWYDFTSPVHLPAWMNTPLTIAGVLAGLERALRLRHNWLLD